MQVETIQKYQSLALEHLDSLNVLLVDDEPAVVETLKLFLQNMGIGHIQTTNCGNNALDHLEKNHYDFIFMDLMMPGMNGIDVLKEIQQHHQLTSVIIMTGYPSMNVVINAMHNGAADFLVKPFNFKDIKIILERIQRLHLLREKNWQLALHSPQTLEPYSDIDCYEVKNVPGSGIVNPFQSRPTSCLTDVTR